MKIVKIVVIPALLAVLVYGAYLFFRDRDTTHSPLPDEGIKVIQITPGD